MAVQKSKKSRSRRGMRRAHLTSSLSLAVQALQIDQTTGEIHSRHHVTKHGYYKGKQVILSRKATKKAETDLE